MIVIRNYFMNWRRPSTPFSKKWKNFSQDLKNTIKQHTNTHARTHLTVQENLQQNFLSLYKKQLTHRTYAQTCQNWDAQRIQTHNILWDGFVCLMTEYWIKKARKSKCVLWYSWVSTASINVTDKTINVIFSVDNPVQVHCRQWNENLKKKQKKQYPLYKNNQAYSQYYANQLEHGDYNAKCDALTFPFNYRNDVTVVI